MRSCVLATEPNAGVAEPRPGRTLGVSDLLSTAFVCSLFTATLSVRSRPEHQARPLVPSNIVEDSGQRAPHGNQPDVTVRSPTCLTTPRAFVAIDHLVDLINSAMQ